MVSFSLISTSTPQLRHPLAHLPHPSTLTFSACLLIPLGSRIHLRVLQLRNELVPGWICLRPRPVSHVVCVLPSPPSTPSQPPAHACSTPRTTDTTASMDGPPASVTSVLLGSPVVSPQPLPRSCVSSCSLKCLACLVLPTRSAMMRFALQTFLRVTFPPRPSALSAVPSPADSDDDHS
jgi:hypothetical protein